MTHALPIDVYRERIARAQVLLNAKGLSALVIGQGAQLAYLTGSWISTHERLTALVIPASGTPTFVLPAVDRGDLLTSPVGELDFNIKGWIDGERPHQLVVDALKINEQAHGIIGVGQDLSADHLLTLQALLPDCSWVLANDVLSELFINKDSAELEQLRAAGAAIDLVHAQVPGLLVAGKTEAQVAEELIALILQEHDAVDFVIVGSGPNGANPHHDFSDRVLSQGELVVVDIGGTYGAGYHSDSTRTYVVGGDKEILDKELTRMYDVLFDAQEQAVQAVKPGITAEQIDAVARNIISDAGYGEYFIHRTGHGIGLSTHEEPFIMAGNELVLQPGMAFSIEPGIYIPGRAGARIEDIVTVTETGVERLNNRPRQL